MEEDTIDFLATRRSKRSTAGNRMEAALAEMTLDDVGGDVGEDNDFFLEKEEEDVFGSDFESTDEEADQEEIDLGEKMIQDEDKRARKDARTRLDKATAAAHARQKVTFNPQTRAAPPSSASRPKRRVSLGLAVNAETGEPIERRGGKRHSQRKHTVLNTSATVSRMKHAEERRATFTKKVKQETRIPTQAELIARALDNEEGNIVSHRDYLQLEEEKRRRAQVVRTAVQGPLLRWVSKVEEVKVVTPALPPQLASNPYGFLYGGVTGYTSSSSGVSTPTGSAPPPTSTNPYLSSPTIFSPSTTNLPSASTLPAVPYAQYAYPYFGASPQPPVRSTEKVSKSYVIHELGQYDTVPKPQWEDTMTAMFGDQVKWEDMRVYVTKGRPLARPKQTCLLTGLPARYLDPRTNVPFANAQAYGILTRLLRHEFVWNEGMGCYVAAQDQVHAQGLEVGNDARSERGEDMEVE